MHHTIELHDKDDLIVHSARIKTEFDVSPILIGWGGKTYVYTATTDSHPSTDTSVVNVYHEVTVFELTGD